MANDTARYVFVLIFLATLSWWEIECKHTNRELRGIVGVGN